MTVSLIGSPRKTSEEARLDKNRRIKESIKATKARRKTQTCSCLLYTSDAADE